MDGCDGRNSLLWGAPCLYAKGLHYSGLGLGLKLSSFAITHMLDECTCMTAHNSSCKMIRYFGAEFYSTLLGDNNKSLNQTQNQMGITKS